jgi:hypothetical protein
MIALNWWREEIQYPAKAEPEWSSLVERWYQLDTPAYVLAETYWRLRTRLPQPPEWLLLSSPGASNLTDSQFAASAAPSPAKFVHTLPNIRSASLLQVMRWSGKVLCIQNDPYTIVSALTEAVHLLNEGPTWIAAVTGLNGQFTGHLLTLGGSDAAADLKISKTSSGTRFTGEDRDKDLLLWINDGAVAGRPFTAPGFTLRSSFGQPVDLRRSES